MLVVDVTGAQTTNFTDEAWSCSVRTYSLRTRPDSMDQNILKERIDSLISLACDCNKAVIKFKKKKKVN